MVNLSVLCLVGADHQEKIPDVVFARRKLEVVFCDLGRLHAFPFRELSGIEVGDGASVGDYRLLLEVADEPVAGAGRDEVCKEEEVKEYSGGMLVYSIVWQRRGL